MFEGVRALHLHPLHLVVAQSKVEPEGSASDGPVPSSGKLDCIDIPWVKVVAKDQLHPASVSVIPEFPAAVTALKTDFDVVSSVVLSAFAT